MEKILKQIIEKLSSLEEGQRSLGCTVDKLETKMDSLESIQREMSQDIKHLNRKVDAIYEQTADLTEFKTRTLLKQEDTDIILKRHETDIAVLKQIIIR